MNYFADVGITMLTFAMLAVSLNLLQGVAGQMSMAPAAFFGIGAFVAGRLVLAPPVGGVRDGALWGLGWPQLPSALAGGVVACVAALILSIPAGRRVTGEHLILLTMAFQVIAQELFAAADGVTGGTFGLYGLPPFNLFGVQMSDAVDAFWVFLIVAILVTGLCGWLSGSAFGRSLRSVREDEVAARSLGKETWLLKGTAFGIAALIGGFAGALNGLYHQYVSPAAYTIDTSISVVAFVVLGGLGNTFGSLIGALVLSLIAPLLQIIPAIGNDAIPWQGVIFGLVLVAVALWRPDGLFPERFRTPKSLPISAKGVSVESPKKSRTALSRRERPSENGPIVQVRRLSKSFGGVHAISDINIELWPGTVTALIGPNGAGKTTIFNLMTGELKADEGDVLVGGRSVMGHSPSQIVHLGMARSFQDVRAFQSLTILDNVRTAVPRQIGDNPLGAFAVPRVFADDRRAVAVATECLAQVGISSGLDRIVSNLSYAEQKLVVIARLLATGAEILLLDEPTAGIDEAAIHSVIAAIKRLRDNGTTVCIVEHSLPVVESLADTAVFLDQGTVLATGTVQELVARKDLTEVYFGV